MKSETKDFDWTKFKRSAKKEVYNFWKLNTDSPLSEVTFTKIMINIVGKEDFIPKALKQFGDDWSEIYENTKKDYGFWGGSTDGRIL